MADSDNESGGQHTSSLREQDRFLPIANVSRVMKRALPANGKISKDAKETVQECVSEFISFVTGEASDKCLREKRKTVNGDDLIWAMTTLGFEEYVEPLKVYLQKFRELEGEKSGYGGAAGTQQKEDTVPVVPEPVRGADVYFQQIGGGSLGFGTRGAGGSSAGGFGR